jgi:MFS family permease
MAIYLILFLGLLMWMSFMGSRVLMSLMALELGASSAAIGMLIALYALGPLLLSVYSGKVVDRFGSYRPIVFGLIGLAAGLVIPYLVPTFAALCVAALLMGIAFVFLNIAMQNLVTSFGDAEARTRNVSLQSLAISLAALLGPLLVGISIDHRGHVPTFLYLALIVVCAWIGWMLCRGLVSRQGRGAKHGAGGGILNLLEQPRLRNVIVTSALVVAGIDLYTFYMPIYGHAVGLSATMIGIVLGAHAAATFVVRIFLPLLLRRWDEDRVMTASMLLAGATFLMFPFVERVTSLLLLSFVLGLGLGVGQPLSVIMTYNRAPAGRTGEALGLRFSLVNLTHMIIPLAFGTIGSALGLVTVFLANSALMLGGGYAHHRGASRRTKE